MDYPDPEAFPLACPVHGDDVCAVCRMPSSETLAGLHVLACNHAESGIAEDEHCGSAWCGWWGMTICLDCLCGTYGPESGIVLDWFRAALPPMRIPA